MHKKIIIILLSLVFILTACAPAATPEPMPDQSMDVDVDVPADEMPAEMEESIDDMKAEEPSGDRMGEDSQDTMGKQDDEMMESPAEEMNADEPSSEMMDAPAWYSVPLTDVQTGETFTINDFKGKVVLVETLAMWCSNCRKQQRQVKALHETLEMEHDLVSVGLDIDPNEVASDLKAYTAQNGFDWIYAVAPPEVSREIGNLYGAQFLNPPSTPIVIIDRDGVAHPLPFGIKSADELEAFLEPFLKEGM